MAILRSVARGPGISQACLLLEAFALALGGVVSGLALLYIGIFAAHDYVLDNYGLYLSSMPPGQYEWTLLGGILGCALLMGTVPAWRAYRQSLADGLSIRL
ncbi:ABC transporter permease, partial [Pseudomonas syringae pv. actinidiae]|nr:ABC transporter permease [Pseudomonas syringae pv. actinidiae]